MLFPSSNDGKKTISNFEPACVAMVAANLQLLNGVVILSGGKKSAIHHENWGFHQTNLGYRNLPCLGWRILPRNMAFSNMARTMVVNPWSKQLEIHWFWETPASPIQVRSDMCHPWKNSLIVLMAYLCHIFFSPDFRPLYKDDCTYVVYTYIVIIRLFIWLKCICIYIMCIYIYIYIGTSWCACSGWQWMCLNICD